MTAVQEQAVIDFYRYPPIGEDNWEYAFAAAKVRVLESMMLAKNTLCDMANAANFEQAADLLAGGEYALSGRSKSNVEMEKMLLEKRSQTRQLFAELMLDTDIVGMMRAREDFANMRLAIRRMVTDAKIGLDYSNEGSVPAEEFEEIFEQENYSRFPEYLQEAVENAILGYYEKKDIRRIDYQIDLAQAQYRIRRAQEIGSIFCLSYFRMQIDLTNIRTMLRLKAAERLDRDLFLPGGYLETERFTQGLGLSYDAVIPLFFATPYDQILEEGVHYLVSKQSFLRLEKACEEHVLGFMKTTRSIAAGPQPVIAYLLMKEGEIRTVRMLLTGKMNRLEPGLLLDRLAER